MAIDYSGLISEGGRAALSSIKNMPPDQQRAKMNDMLANGLLPFSVAMAVDKQLRQPLKENAPSPRPGSVMEEKLNLLNQTQSSGIDQLPAPDMQQAQFAGGGIVAFAGDEGSLVGDPDPFAGLTGMDPKNSRYPYLQHLQNIYNQNKTKPTREAELARVDAQQKEGKYGKYSEALANYGQILKDREKGIDEAGDKRKARRAGWLAMAQAGAEGKGLLAGATAGLAKNAEVSDAREEKRKTELRELQKEQYTLQLGLEQARASGNQQAETAYLAELDRNAKAQDMLGRGLAGLYEIDSRERTAKLDRAAQAQKDSINVDFFNRRKALQAKLRGATPIEAERIKAEIDALDADWNTVNKNVGAASGYRADVGAENARAANLVKLMSSDIYIQAEAEANTALAAYNDPTLSKDEKDKLLNKYLTAQGRLKQMRASVMGESLAEEPTGTPSAEAGLAGAGVPPPMTGRSVAPTGAPVAPNDKYAR